MQRAALIAAAVTIVATAGLHSILGERRLITPLIRTSDGVMRSDLAATVLRLAWHFTSILMILSAALLLLQPTRTTIAAIGATYFAVGLLDGLFTRGRHIGWLPLTLSGALTLAALL